MLKKKCSQHAELLKKQEQLFDFSMMGLKLQLKRWCLFRFWAKAKTISIFCRHCGPQSVGLIHFHFPNESESNFEICRESGDLGILHLATHHHAPPHTRVVSIFYNPTICPPPVLFGAWRLKSNFCNLSASYLLQSHQILCTCSSRRMTCKSCCRRWNECNKCKKFSLRANRFSEGNKGFCRLKCKM